MTLEKELTELLNRHSRETPSNTPDFVLARYMMACLEAYETAIKERSQANQHIPLTEVIEATKNPMPPIESVLERWMEGGKK